ncbi:HAD family hydrolase [uncultured Cytophaga sp.]|uniref:KdsC family phosphatase n=1 Tax=uncultured Cytophaga sp. TaxID=160238 RepID=UPI00260B470E|nr:HAD-IIIA family hydrolase [uncultured Cytophaga sp.]
MAEFSDINTFIFDVDGVLTDGSIIAYETGEQPRTFNIKDGYGIERALLAGYHIVIISGGKQESVRKRLNFLGIKDVFLGVKDKVSVFAEYTATRSLDPKTILYMGDDIPDYKMLQLVGLPTCPADASIDIKPICKYVSSFNGGQGAVRDVIEKVMRAQGKWDHKNW